MFKIFNMVNEIIEKKEENKMFYEKIKKDKFFNEDQLNAITKATNLMDNGILKQSSK